MLTPLLVKQDAERAPPWLEALPDSAVLVDEGGTIFAVNTLWREFAAANGGDPQAYLGKNYLEVCRGVPGDEDGNLPRQLQAVLKGCTQSLQWEYSCHSPLERRWFRLSATRIQEQNRVYVVIIHRNISYGRLSDETAHAREQQLESILAHTREGLVVVQEQQIIRYANPRACEFLGATLDQLMGQKLDVPVPSSAGQIIQVQPAGKQTRTLEIFGVQSDWEGYPAWLVHLHDITSQVAAEKALTENKDLLERTNQVARVGGWETDLSSGELWWTSVTRDILEVDHTEAPPPLY